MDKEMAEWLLFVLEYTDVDDEEDDQMKKKVVEYLESISKD